MLNAMFHGQATSDGQPFVSLKLLSDDFLIANSGYSVNFEKPFPDYSTNMQYQDLHYTKVPRILHNVDRASMSVGIEKRVPILDHRLVEFSFSAPLDVRLRDGHMRFFMREIARRILPSRLLNMPKRHSSDPQRAWFKNELADWGIGIIESKSFRERGIFNQNEVLEEFKKYRKLEDPPTSYHLWQCICIELWWRLFIDGSSRFSMNQ